MINFGERIAHSVAIGNRLQKHTKHMNHGERNISAAMGYVPQIQHNDLFSYLVIFHALIKTT